MSSIVERADPTTAHSNQWQRLAAALLFGIAMQLLMAIAYTILRYGPMFRAELWNIPAGAVVVALTLAVGGAAVIRRMMPPETPLTTVAFIAILSNVAGGVGLYAIVYLADRAGLSM